MGLLRQETDSEGGLLRKEVDKTEFAPDVKDALGMRREYAHAQQSSGIRTRKEDEPVKFLGKFPIDVDADTTAPSPYDVENPEPALSDSGIAPRDFPPSTQPETPLKSPGIVDQFFPSSGRIEDTPDQPATSPSATAVKELLQPAGAGVTGLERKQTPQEEYNQLAAAPHPKDRNGRLKSAILNAFLQMGDQANSVIASGRPVDEYGLASVFGKGLGGAARGAFDPSIDEQNKRLAKMDGLARWIQQTHNIEQMQAETAKTQAEADNLQTKPQRDADAAAAKAKTADVKAKRAAVLANLRLFKDQKLDPSNPTHARLLEKAADAGIEIDPVSWNNARSNVAYLNTVDPDDPSKMVRMSVNKATGETSVILHDGESVRPAEQLSFDERQKEFADRMKLSVDTYKLRVKSVAQQERHNVESERRAREAQGLAIMRVKIAYPAAKDRADMLGIDFPDYEEVLKEMGVDVVKK
jgi:hypothetical protein